MTELSLTVSPALAPDEVRTLEAVADVLIPRYEDHPSASAAGVGDRWIQVALSLRPDLVGPLRSVLAEIAGDGDVAAQVGDLGRRDPERFSAVANAVAGAYLMSPAARAAIGYPGQEARPLVVDVEDHIDLLEAVVERGPIYRPTPGEKL